MKALLVFLVAVSTACCLTLRQKELVDELLHELQDQESLEEERSMSKPADSPNVEDERESDQQLQTRLRELGQQRIAKIERENEVEGRGIAKMIAMVRKCTHIKYTGYYNYGCYCGLGGSGTPVDSVDRCCKIHDECFGNVQNNCFSLTPYLTMLSWYSYKCDKEAGVIECEDTPGNCRRLTCECDRALALCFEKTTFDYNVKNEGYKGKC